MNKKNAMRDFIKKINDSNLMTQFIKNIFNYENFYDYNYLFRMIDNEDEVIIDIYDNVSDNRFNRYIFSFVNTGYDIKVIDEKNVFVSYINIKDVIDNDNKLLKLAYLFKIADSEMLAYANSFLDDIFVEILKDIIENDS